MKFCEGNSKKKYQEKKEEKYSKVKKHLNVWKNWNRIFQISDSKIEFYH